MNKKASEIKNENKEQSLDERIDPRKLQRLRNEKGLTQTDLVNKLNSICNVNLRVQSISCWETKYRAIPTMYNSAIAKILGCDIKDLTFDMSNSSKETDKYEIPPEKLKKFDKQPVYVVFENLEHSSGWAIYNDSKKLLLFADYFVKCNVKNKSIMKFYTTDVKYYDIFCQTRKKIDLSTALALERVYINILSEDPIVKTRYDGWYKPLDDKKGFINPIGLILPVEGFGIYYHVFKE